VRRMRVEVWGDESRIMEKLKKKDEKFINFINLNIN